MMFKLSCLALLLQAYFMATASPEFSYFSNGADWNTAFPDCGGSSQSPINITRANVQAAATGSRPFSMILNSNTTTITYTVGHNVNTAGTFSYVNTLDSNGVPSLFIDTGFHVHAPGEHQIDGVLGDAEIHFVHQINGTSTSTYQYVVVGLIFKKSAGVSDPLIAGWNVNTAAGATNQFNMNSVALSNILASQNFFTYTGSFTAPPCTQSVRFFLIDKLFDISAAQLTTFQNLFANNNAFAGGKGNNRLTQALNGRIVNSITVPAANITSAIIPQATTASVFILRGILAFFGAFLFFK